MAQSLGDGSDACGAARLVLRLYVAGGAPNSVRALANLAIIGRDCLSGRYDLEVVDVLREPRRALDEGILLTPTLVRLAPLPRTMVVGDLSRTEDVLSAIAAGVPWLEAEGGGL